MPGDMTLRRPIVIRHSHSQVNSVHRTAYIHLNFIDASADISISEAAMLVSQVAAKWNDIQLRQMPQ